MPRFGYSVYVACSLTHATPIFRQSIEAFKKKLEPICNVLRFLGLKSGRTPHELYQYDIHECVYRSDLVVAICDLPSLGLGYEMGTQAEARQRPCLCLAQELSLVSEIIMDTRRAGYEFRRYSDLLADGVEFVTDKLRRMQEAEASHFPLFRLLRSGQDQLHVSS